MRKSLYNIDYLIIFIISCFCISLELFLTRVLNLKAWNHVVYVVIPYAILGYGIGANFCLLFSDSINKVNKNKLIGSTLIFIPVLSIIITLTIVKLPILIHDLQFALLEPKSFFMLLLAYSIFMFPFVFIGFLVVLLFKIHKEDTNKLYFFDLVGAGLGAILFYFLINYFQIIHSILVLSFFCVLTGLYKIFPKRKIFVTIFFLIVFIILFNLIKEPEDYLIDRNKKWEWIPGYVKSEDFTHKVSRWHPLGRTDIYSINTEAIRNKFFIQAPGTFEINMVPYPEFAYISTNYLAGSPIYQLNEEGISKQNSKLELFSQSLEVPYVILNKPKVLIIGAGGGRDIFVAHSHGAEQIIGAEINPGIVKELSPGGKLYDYSGRIYTKDGTKVYAIDGRNLVKKMPENSFDLIVLNGVDTFSGLSSGAYAYAESYLYTKEAIIDYLRILKPNGIICFNRWIFPDLPRETLKLEAIILDSLQSLDVKAPWLHLVIGAHKGWSNTLVKKDAFTQNEIDLLSKYFLDHEAISAFPPHPSILIEGSPLRVFHEYAQSFMANSQLKFQEMYPYDISVVKDDNPFFYKYYKVKGFNPLASIAAHHTGTVVFLTQFLILFQTTVFILIFILMPLVIFKIKGIKGLPKNTMLPFVVYFSCLGLGYMFVEIPLMQKFTLLLGSPIYSISVVLAVLLFSSGLGSFALDKLIGIFKGNKNLLSISTFMLVFYVIFLLGLGNRIYDLFLGLPFLGCVFAISALIFPLGFILGFYFPAGLNLLSKDYENSISWAWGINCGFSVLGSILSIIVAQFLGFSTILITSCVLYLIALLTYLKLAEKF